VATVAQVIDVDGEMSEETVYEVQVEPKDPSPSDPFVPLNLVCHTLETYHTVACTPQACHGMH
jgi:hypothetical protein